MKLLEILRFEAAYQLRRPWLWLFLAFFVAAAWLLLYTVLLPDARLDGYLYNAPTTIAAIMPIIGLFALLMTAAIAGDSATRDGETRIDALLFVTPVSNIEYIGGRYLGAFLLNALVLLLVPLLHLVVVLAAGMEPELLGPIGVRGYVDAWLVFGLPNAFVGSALVFAAAALTRRPMAAWGVAALMFFLSLFSTEVFAKEFGRWRLARLIDPSGYEPLRQALAAMTLEQRNSLLLPLGGDQIGNRLIWIGVGLLALLVVLLRFRFQHQSVRQGFLGRRGTTKPETEAQPGSGGTVALPQAPRSFGFASRVRQAGAIARMSFLDMIRSPALLLLVLSAVLIVLMGSELLEHLGVPLTPRTLRIIDLFGAGEVLLPGTIIPLLILFFAGELVWRDRDTRIAALVDAAPIRDRAAILGRFVAFAALLVVLQAFVMAAGIVLQTVLGYTDYQLGLYASVMFGLQLVDYLLWAALAMAVHAMVDQKYAGHLVVVLIWAFATFSGAQGVENNLLKWASEPDWRYSDMSGFDASLLPFFSFRLWWAGWALLLAVAMRLLWVRGVDEPVMRKLGLARRRFRGATAVASAAAVAIVLATGAFTFYNTNIRNSFVTSEERTERRVEYERRYSRYAESPQPLRVAVTLRVELDPSRGAADVSGEYVLVNRTGEAIDTIHLATATEVTTTNVAFDRAASLMHDDRELHHRIYVLERPLLPGDSLRLGFAVRHRRNGFRNDGVAHAVERNGTYVEAHEWLPALGYQKGRELSNDGARRAYGLEPREGMAALGDEAARHDFDGGEPVRLDITIGTAPDQIAATAGTLRREWSESGRRWFRYVTDAPIRGEFSFFSADYAVRTARAAGVDIVVLHHPEHAATVDGIARAAVASLEWYTEAFGPYPHHQLRIVEYPSQGIGASAPMTAIAYTEGYALMDSESDARDLDFAGGVMAHEIAHQWWGNMLYPARMEGAALLTESLAWYSAMGVIERMYDPEHLRRLLAVMRDAYLTPRSRAAVPLVRADDFFLAYRKGPFAMFALREYLGEERVSAALRALLAAHGAGETPLATSMDLHRELRAVAPDSLDDLVDALLLRNTFWDLAADSARATRTAAGEWRVMIDVRAAKAVVDTAGVETAMPMDDIVEIGVFGAVSSGGLGEPLYLARHRIGPGTQRIAITVPSEPARAGIDPYNLLIDTDQFDNVVDVTKSSRGPTSDYDTPAVSRRPRP